MGRYRLPVTGRGAGGRRCRGTSCRGQPEVDATGCAATGCCFGGTVALELARDGADLKAVVSFHGVLSTTRPRGCRLAGDQLRQRAARLHQPVRRRLS
ncbi:dienelactone hydrolase family protein [Bradyrhizobium sp. USDA 3364]